MTIAYMTHKYTTLVQTKYTISFCGKNKSKKNIEFRNKKQDASFNDTNFKKKSTVREQIALVKAIIKFT